MNFQSTVETVLRWTDSCQTKEQLGLIRDVVDRFVKERFKHHVSYSDMCHAEMEISNSINDKEYALELSAATSAALL